MQNVQRKKDDLKVICSLKDNFNVHYKTDFICEYKANKYFDIFEKNLVYNTPEQSKVTVFGKEHYIARKQVAYGDLGTHYTFAGNTVYANDWNCKNAICTILKNIKHKVEIFTGKKFNFVLMNRYKDGNDKIMAHRDSEKELGIDPTIVGVSFGSVRDVCFAPYKFIPEILQKRITIELGHGSVFVMHPPTNDHWTHEIPIRANVKTPRISLTFRYLHL